MRGVYSSYCANERGLLVTLSISMYLGPVRPIADVIEIPTGRYDGLQTSLGDIVSFRLPPVFPHMDHSIWQDLVCVCVCVCECMCVSGCEWVCAS